MLARGLANDERSLQDAINEIASIPMVDGVDFDTTAISIATIREGSPRSAKGSEVRVRRVDDDPARPATAIKSLRGIWTSGGGTDELVEERRRERELERAQGSKAGHWSSSIAGRCSHT